MNGSQIWAIAQKDIRSITSNVQVWLGLVLLPVLFSILLPGGLILLIKTGRWRGGDVAGLLERMLGQLPEGPLKEHLTGLPGMEHQMIYLFANYMLGSFFLLIPVLNALMISLNSMVGEKERRTLESLLFAPIDLKSLFLGKVLAAFIPSYAVTVASFLLCALVVDGLTYPMFGELIFPSVNWIIILLWVAPLFTLLTILVSTYVSARTKSFQEAQQLGGLIVLPVVALAVSQLTGIVLVDSSVLLAAGLALLALDAALLVQLSKKNESHALFERQVH